MSKYNTFEDLEVWKLGISLYIDLTKVFNVKEFKDYYFRDQILRASLSISNNIAEGFEKQSDKELIRFLYISKGSCGEVRSMIYTAKLQNFITENSYQDFRKRCITISVKLNNLIKYLSKC